MARFLLIAFVSAGVVIALQGWLIIKGRRKARPLLFEKPLVDVLDLKKESDVLRVLGRLRLVYGVFLVVVGIWGLSGL